MRPPRRKAHIPDQSAGSSNFEAVCQSEVDEFEVVRSFADHHVLGLEVAVEVACVVHGLEGGDHLECDEGHGGQRQVLPQLQEELLEVGIELLHYDVGVFLQLVEEVDQWEVRTRTQVSQNRELFLH